MEATGKSEMGYNVFISWSGDRSWGVAETLRTWIPRVIQAAKPWMSKADIEKGTRSLDEIAKALEGIKLGIVCLTPENLGAPWLLFEAGALSKTVDDKARLYTYLLGGLEHQHIKAPLGIFHGTKAEKEDTRKMLYSLNRAVSSEPLAEQDVDAIFDAMWPTLEQTLRKVAETEAKEPPKRSLDDMVAEILELTRVQCRRWPIDLSYLLPESVRLEDSLRPRWSERAARILAGEEAPKTPEKLPRPRGQDQT